LRIGWLIVLAAHPLEKSAPVSQMQAYIAKSDVFPTCVRCVEHLLCLHYRV